MDSVGIYITNLKVHIKKTLYITASSFWTSGIYDGGSFVWRWAANGIAFSQWAPWDIGQPTSNPTAVHRVIITHSNRYSAFWRAVSNTQSHRYICEVPRTTTPTLPCSDTDLVILLDSSGRIGTQQYKKARSFAANLASDFKGRKLGRVGFSIFSNDAYTLVSITNTLTPQQINATILTFPHLNYGTATYVGIDNAVAQFTSSLRGVPHNIVVITNGKSNNSILTADAASRANQIGARILSVGITVSADLNELLVLANGDSNNVFTTNGVDNLILLLDPIINKICSNN